MIQTIGKKARQEAGAIVDGSSNGHAVLPMMTAAQVMARSKELAAAVDSERADDVEKLKGEWFDHDSFGARFYVGPMDGTGYAELLAVPKYAFHDGQMKQISGASKDRETSDLIYLHHGILWPKQTPDSVRALYGAKTCGPDNLRLISTIQQYNAPAEELDARMKVFFGTHIAEVMFWNVMFNANLVPDVARLMAAAEPLSEEDQARKLMIESMMPLIPQLNAWLDIEATAKNMGIPITQAAALEAVRARNALADMAE